MIRPCDACGEPYECQRSTSKTCSRRCRQRLALMPPPVKKAKKKAPAKKRAPARKRAPTKSTVTVKGTGEQVAVDGDGDLLPRSTVYDSTYRALADAGRLDHPLGAASLVLAKRLDSPYFKDTGSGLASLARQLDASLKIALAGAAKKSGLDELRERREQRRRSA